MGINKLLDKLDDFRGPSNAEQQKKAKKLQIIIKKLEDKKTELEQEVIAESKVDDTSARYHELTEKLKVVSKLIRKAKEHNGGSQA
ncbi:MAG: hypothetical protein OEN02_09535 [Gammaproteobacteria bacterium]|nr:hypothetical protein [Gammaproteobacteria bacterium]MDH3536309.1 hypothetical protein [Gammaproteobacteria bacterium]